MHGQQAATQIVLFFQSHAQSAHVDVDGSFVAVEIVAPHALE
jgi:hypothetical protein